MPSADRGPRPAALLAALLLQAAGPPALAAQQWRSADPWVYLDHRILAAGCDSSGAPFGELAWSVRGTMYPFAHSLPLHEGRFDDPPPGSGEPPEWRTELQPPLRIGLGRERAFLLQFTSEHLRGTGSVSRVLVVRCRNRRLEVVFEAGGEGLTVDAGADTLRLRYPVWRVRDSHASPTGTRRAAWRWDRASDRFLSVSGASGRNRDSSPTTPRMP